MRVCDIKMVVVACKNFSFIYTSRDVVMYSVLQIYLVKGSFRYS